MNRALSLLLLLAACTSDEKTTTPDTQSTDTGPAPFAITFEQGAAASVCAPPQPLFRGESNRGAGTHPGELTIAGRTVPVTLTFDADGAYEIRSNATTPSVYDACEQETSSTCLIDASLSVDVGAESATTANALELSNDVEDLFVDADSDGYGSGEGTRGCVGDLAGAAIVDGDCDDEDPTRNPSVPEQCDGIDNDCDEEIDNGFPYTDWRVDVDGDGFGDENGNPVESTCDGPSDPSYVGNDLDCNDADPEIKPGADEVCDGLDNDCDYQADDDDPEGVIGGLSFWIDYDRDGFYTDIPISQCAPPSADYVVYQPVVDVDCDDDNSVLTPFDGDGDGASSCEGDCDDGSALWNTRDDDGDGFATCDGDCLDTVASPIAIATFPGGVEIPGDAIDGDCNGFEDCYLDSDGDGYPPANAAVLVDATEAGSFSCAAVDGWTDDNATDCDDSDPDVRPYTSELIGNTVDENCDGLWLCHSDADEDGFVYPYANPQVYVPCGTPGSGTAVFDSAPDCAPYSPSIYPGADEVACDGVIQDCDRSDDASVEILRSTGVWLYDGPASVQLAEAFADAQPNDTLSLCPIDYQGEGHVITESITIEGNGATLDGGYLFTFGQGSCPVGAETLLTIDGATSVLLHDVGFAHGCQSPDGDGYGGALELVNGAEITLDGVDITAVSADFGGGIAVRDSSELIFTRGSCDNCSAIEGGTFWIDDNATAFVEGVPGVQDLTFTGTRADDGGLAFVLGTFVGTGFDVLESFGGRGQSFYTIGSVDLQFVFIASGNGQTVGSSRSFYTAGALSIVDSTIATEPSGVPAFTLLTPGTLQIERVADIVNSVGNIECASALPTPLLFSSDSVTSCTGQVCVP